MVTSVPCLLGETCGAARDWGRRALSVGMVGLSAFQVVPASALSHEGFCHLARGGGGSCLSLSPSNSPTTRRTVLRSDGVPPLHPTTPPGLCNLFVPSSLFCNQWGGKRKRKAYSLSFLSRGINKKTRCLVEMVVNDQAEPPGWTERGRLSRGLAEGRWDPSSKAPSHQRSWFCGSPPPSSTSGP